MISEENEKSLAFEHPTPTVIPSEQRVTVLVIYRYKKEEVTMETSRTRGDKVAVAGLDVRVAPLLQARVAAVGVMFVGVARLLEPLLEEFLVLLEHQELAEKHVCLESEQVTSQPQVGVTERWRVDGWLTLSKPFSECFLPSTSPMPATAVTSFSPMGSPTKS